MRWPIMACAALVSVCGAAHAQWVWTPETGRFVRMDNLPKETPELQVEHERTLVLQGDYSEAWDEADKFDRFFSDSEYADENQYLRGEIRLGQERYVDAAEEYQKVVSTHPESALYDDVIQKQYDIGDTLYEKGLKRVGDGETSAWMSRRPLSWIQSLRRRPFKNAVDVYTIVIENQPFTPEAAEAQYKIGKCHFAREKYLEAGFEFRRVIEDYPDSEWVREASFDLTRCYEESSLDPDYDQAPARLAMESVSEFVRRFPDDPRVDERIEISEEMRENIAEQRFRSAEYYERRRSMVAARIYYDVAAYQFEGTEASKKAIEWIETHPVQPDLYAKFLGRAVAEQ